MILVDRVHRLKRGKVIRGVKCVSASDPYLDENRCLPGTLMVEALAQLGAFLIELSATQPSQAVLVAIEGCKLSHAARPGDQLRLQCRLSSSTQVHGMIFLAGSQAQRVAQAVLTFALRPLESEAVQAARREVYRQWTAHLRLDFPLP